MINIKTFSQPTKEKLILFLILFYLPAVVIFGDFGVGIYSKGHVYLLIGFLVGAYLISCALCLIRQVNQFLKPTSFKLLIFGLFTGINFSIGVPFLDTNTMSIAQGSFVDLLSRTILRDLLYVPLMLLHFYVYAAVIDLIVRLIKKKEELEINFGILKRKWWFWVIIVILVLGIIWRILDLGFF